MEHLICLKKNYNSLEDLLTGKKTMIVLASYGKIFPVEKMHMGDQVYFTDNSNPTIIKGSAVISNMLCLSEVSLEEAGVILAGNRDKLRLSKEGFRKVIGKKYIVLIEFSKITSVDPLEIVSKGQLASWTVIYS
ncbi:MAG: hypothetical protein ACK5JH_10320 [Anaerocolumna sp.]